MTRKLHITLVLLLAASISLLFHCIFSTAAMKAAKAWEESHSSTMSITLIERTRDGFVAENEDGETIELLEEDFEELKEAEEGQKYLYTFSNPMPNNKNLQLQRAKTAWIVFLCCLCATLVACLITLMPTKKKRKERKDKNHE